MNPEAAAATVTKPVTFHFRENPRTKIKRASITINATMPTADTVADIYNAGGRGLAKLVELMESAISGHIRNILADETITAANFPTSQADWDAYVAVPDAERAARGISKEIWDAFKADYIKCMPDLTGRPLEAIKLGAKLMVDNRFSTIKTDKKSIAKLMEYLAIYVQSPGAEDFLDCITVLEEKAAVFLATDNSALAENL